VHAPPPQAILAIGEQNTNMTSRPEFDEIGYWSEIKLDIVKDYAAAYSRILAAKKLKHVYIDAFAGAGQHISKATGELVPGSPLNALNVLPPFREYYLIDLDSSRVTGLRKLFGDRSNVHIEAGDCNRVFTRQSLPHA
jgi:three-Cys-motif partner protein